jgi:thymidylate synthase (FAD)
MFIDTNLTGMEEDLPALTLSKENRSILLSNEKDANVIYHLLKKGKKKKNSGDIVKLIVTDNWITEEVFTINLRSLINFFNLRDSGAAYYQIRMLAQEMKKALPEHYHIYF